MYRFLLPGLLLFLMLPACDEKPSVNETATTQASPLSTKTHPQVNHQPTKNSPQHIHRFSDYSLIEQHLNPSQSTFTLKDPEGKIIDEHTGRIAWLMPGFQQPLIFVINRPHFGPPPVDYPDELWINHQEITSLPRNMKFIKRTPRHVLLEGMDLDAMVNVSITHIGRWKADNSETYLVYYLYQEIRMRTEHMNIRGNHKLLLINQQHKIAINHGAISQAPHLIRGKLFHDAEGKKPIELNLLEIPE